MMNIIKAKKRERSNQYLKDRDLFWESKIEEFTKKSQPLWNGDVYYLDFKEGNSLYLGLCEYKDIIFCEEKGSEEISEKYGKEHVFTYLNVQILINYKDLHLFGTKQVGDTREIICVGGTLRLEDGQKIESFENVVEYAKKEVDVETKLDIRRDDLEFLYFIFNENIGSFIFQYNLENKKDSGVLNIGEFDGEVYLDKKDVYNSNEYTPNIRLRSIKSFLQDLWKIK